MVVKEQEKSWSNKEQEEVVSGEQGENKAQWEKSEK